MMSGPVIYVDTSEIREGRLAELQGALELLSDFVAQNEPRLVSDAAYLDEARQRMTVVHVHVDAASLELHMNVAGPRFAPFADLIRLRTIDVYGTVGAGVIRRLQEKAQMLGGATVRTHELGAGFIRSI